MTPKEFDEIVAQAKLIAFGEDGQSGKNADYAAAGHLYKVIGREGRCSDIWRKAIRHASAMKTKKYDHKLRRDTLDLLVYCIMYCIVNDEIQIEEERKNVSN